MTDDTPTHLISWSIATVIAVIWFGLFWIPTAVQ